jgi:hypothetical protein
MSDAEAAREQILSFIDGFRTAVIHGDAEYWGTFEQHTGHMKKYLLDLRHEATIHGVYSGQLAAFVLLEGFISAVSTLPDIDHAGFFSAMKGCTQKALDDLEYALRTEADFSCTECAVCEDRELCTKVKEAEEEETPRWGKNGVH